MRNRYNITLSEDIHNKAREKANKKRRSLSRQIEILLEEWLEGWTNPAQQTCDLISKGHEKDCAYNIVLKDDDCVCKKDSGTEKTF